MGKTRKITKNQNRDDASNNGDARPWSDLDHRVLCLVLMRLGVVDFVAFSGVCKPWRSFALSNRKMFMESRPPMMIWISDRAYKKHYYYSLEDFEGRKFKTLLPHSGGRTCVGLTCGYLVLFGKNTRDFWLVNPITRHELHFPNVLFYNNVDPEEGVRAILVFLPSISRWVFLVLCRNTRVIWFFIEGDEEWDYVTSAYPILDLHDFMGKMYTIGIESPGYRCYQLCELRLDQKPKLMLLRTKNSPYPELKFMGFVSSGENLYAMERCLDGESYEVHKLDFGENREMKWVFPEEKTMEELAFFVSEMKHNNAAIKPELWSNSLLTFKRYFFGDPIGNGMFFSADLWYFPHHCSDVNFMHQ